MNMFQEIKGVAILFICLLTNELRYLVVLKNCTLHKCPLTLDLCDKLAY